MCVSVRVRARFCLFGCSVVVWCGRVRVLGSVCCPRVLVPLRLHAIGRVFYSCVHVPATLICMRVLVCVCVSVCVRVCACVC